MALTLAQLIEQQRQAIAALLDRRQPHTDTLTRLRDLATGENRDLTAAEATEATTARDARTAIDAEVAAHQARLDQFEAEQRDQAAIEALSQRVGPITAAGAAVSGVAGQVREHRVGGATTDGPRVYTRESGRQGVSFIRDLYAYQAGGGAFGEVAERLAQHSREMTPVLQQRAVATTVAGSLVVPQYLPELVALPIRNGRPFANLIPDADLPVSGMTLTLPRITTGLTVAPQATQNSNVSNTDTAVTDLTIPVVTAAGQQDLSRQLIERGTGVDEIIFRDLASAYAAEVDRQCIVGDQTGGTARGVQNTSGIGAATALGTTFIANTDLAGAQKFYSKLAGLIAGIAGLGAGVAPQVIVMHPRRWGLLLAITDSSGRPLVTPLATGPYNATALNLAPGSYSGDGANPGDVARTVTVVGQIHGLPVVTDANIPTNVGAATGGEDIAFVMDNTKHVLWENAGGAPEFLKFDQTLGNQLTVKLVAYGYFAFTAGRFPGASGIVGGLDTTTNGMRTPTF